MAKKMVLMDAFVEIQDSGDTFQEISDAVHAVNVEYSAEIHDSTAMGDTGRERISGLKDFNISLDLYQDYDASSIDDILFGIVGESKTIRIRPTSSAVGSDNPQYSGTVLLETYQPFSGGLGETQSISPSFQGSGILARATS